MGHLELVHRVAVSLCGQGPDAEDLVQTTYLKAWERFDSFQKGTNCKAWLLQILRHTWIDVLRHQKVVGTVGPLPAEIADESMPEHESVHPSVEDVLERFSDEQVIKALMQLSEEQRLSLCLKDVELCSIDEIAEIMEVPAGTVKSRVSRARTALKTRLDALARDLGFMGRNQ